MKVVPAIKKMVTAITCFAFGSSGIFLLSGAGTAWSNVLIGGIFVISTFNLILPFCDFLKEWKQKRSAAQIALAKSGGGAGSPAGSGDEAKN